MIRLALLVITVCTVVAIPGITATSSGFQTSIPLDVVQVQDVPYNRETGEPRHIAVTMRNRGTKLIVAWGLRSEARLADTQVLRSFVTADAYENIGRTPPDPSLVPPNQQSVTSMNSVKDDATVVDIVAIPVFAIFDDDTAVGLSAEIDKKFANRVTSISVYRALEQILYETSRTIADPVQAARADRASLEAIADDAVTKHWSHPYVEQRLTSIIDSSRPTNKAVALASLIDEIRSRRIASEAHSQRR